MPETEARADTGVGVTRTVSKSKNDILEITLMLVGAYLKKLWKVNHRVVGFLFVINDCNTLLQVEL